MKLEIKRVRHRIVERDTSELKNIKMGGKEPGCKGGITSRNIETQENREKLEKYDNVGQYRIEEESW